MHPDTYSPEILAKFVHHHSLKLNEQKEKENNRNFFVLWFAVIGAFIAILILLWRVYSLQVEIGNLKRQQNKAPAIRHYEARPQFVTVNQADGIW